MESVVKKLQKVGLTEYEAKAYLGLLSDHLNSASKLSEKSSEMKIHGTGSNFRNKLGGFRRVLPQKSHAGIKSQASSKPQPLLFF